MNSLELKACAKINLGLYLLQKRLDGYHDILTVFQSIDLHDTLHFKQTHSSSTFAISLDGIPVPLGEENLVFRAYRVFCNRMHIPGGLAVHIEKKIPVGAGLGGGSSDAAVTLKAMNQLWETDLPPEELEKMAEEIGSDVPFFIRGGTAIGEGRGEKLTPIKLPMDYWILLVCPGIQISTAWAYSQAKIGLTKKEKLTNFKSIFENYSEKVLRASLKNELEAVVFERHPLLRLLKDGMYQWDAFYASMTGSGSAIYGLFTSREKAEAAESFFSIDGRIRTFVCRPISSVLHNKFQEKKETWKQSLAGGKDGNHGRANFLI